MPRPRCWLGVHRRLLQRTGHERSGPTPATLESNRRVLVNVLCVVFWSGEPLRGCEGLVLLVFVEPRRVADADQQAIGAEQPGDHLGPWLGLGLVDELQASLL